MADDVILLKKRERWWALAGVASFALVVIATSPRGIGLGADSAWYLAAARGLASGEGYVQIDGRPDALFPPLVPAWLALGERLGLDPLAVARCTEAALYALAVWAAGLWMLRLTRPGVVRAAGLLAVLFAVPLFRTSVELLSEPAFDLLALLALAALARHVARGGWRSLLLSALCAGAAGLARWASLPLVLACVVVILLDLRKSAARRAAETVVFGLIAAAPPVLWALRNLAVTGTLAGWRPHSLYTFQQNAVLALNALSAEVFPRALPEALRGALFLAAAAVLACLLLLFLRKRPERLPSLAPLIAFVIIYPAFILVSSTLSRFTHQTFRLYAPAFLPAVLLAFAAADGVTWEISKTWRRRARAITGVLLIAWCAYPAARTVSFTWQYLHDEREGYVAKPWLESPLIAAVRDAHPRDGALWSNEPEALYVLLGVRADLSPRKAGPVSWGRPGELDAFLSKVRDTGGGLLVWTYSIAKVREFCYTPEELGRVVRLEPAGSFPDGEIYRVAPGPGKPD